MSEILTEKENHLAVRSGRLYKVSCAPDIFYVVAQNKDQVRKLLFARGGEQNFKDYTIEREAISETEMIVAEVKGYSKVLEFYKFIEDNDETDYALDCDQ